MTTSAASSARGRVPTGGAWLGFWIALRSAFVVLSSATLVGMVAAIPLAADWFGRAIQREDAPPQVGQMIDLWLDAADIFRPFSRVAGWSGIAIGLALVLSGWFLVLGREWARRAARALLVVEAVHSVATAVWMASLAMGPFGAWAERYQKLMAELMQASGSNRFTLPTQFQGGGLANVLAMGISEAVSLAITAVLFWFAGRPVAREWCRARTGRSSVASPGDRE
jgi:hypothetical protein